MEYKFDFTTKIEDMSPEDMKERIRAGFEFDIPHKIVGIPYLGGDEVVEYKYPELIGLCPATGYPDTYEVNFKMVPGETLPELKSLKFYLMDYKDLPISHEHLADKLYTEFRDAVKPKQFQLTLNTAVRGGIYTDIVKGNLEEVLTDE